jgi:hypothetical protein
MRYNRPSTWTWQTPRKDHQNVRKPKRHKGFLGTLDTPSVSGGRTAELEAVTDLSRSPGLPPFGVVDVQSPRRDEVGDEERKERERDADERPRLLPGKLLDRGIGRVRVHIVDRFQTELNRRVRGRQHGFPGGASGLEGWLPFEEPAKARAEPGPDGIGVGFVPPWLSSRAP